MKKIRLGIIGGGLMGREMASAIGRWCALTDAPVRLELTAVCDLVEEGARMVSRHPFGEIAHRKPSRTPRLRRRCRLRRRAASPARVALPRRPASRKDLFAEKPFGIDLAAARKIRDTAVQLGRFVRCSGEFPFLPGVQKAVRYLRNGELGHVLEIRSGFWHASDLDATKPINWKRQVKFCGEIGVMGDLGMHAVHVPFRLGWRPKRVYAQLQKIYTERPDGKGGMAACDTWDNAMLHCDVEIDGRDVPMRIETKRLAPGEMNTWFLEVLGTDGGVRYSTKEPKTLWIFRRGKEQVWERYDVGMGDSAFPVVTGGIFEAGFSDCFQQMLAAYAAEHAGQLGDRFGCATPDEAVASHELFAAALQSQGKGSVVKLGDPSIAK